MVLDILFLVSNMDVVLLMVCLLDQCLRISFVVLVVENLVVDIVLAPDMDVDSSRCGGIEKRTLLVHVVFVVIVI